MLARQLAYITYVRGSVSTLQILLSPGFYGLLLPTLSREEPEKNPYIIILPLHSFFHIDENMVFRYDKTAYRLRAILSNMIYEVFP